MSDLVYFILGIICAGLGGELFIRGTVRLASCLRVSPSIVAITVSAFATSSPELSVGIASALAETPQIALGNCLGANILNIALVLGIASLIGGIHISRGGIGHTISVAFTTPVVIGLLAFDGMLSRLDGVLLLAVFLVWLALVAIEARKQRSSMGEVNGKGHRWMAVSYLLIGLILLVGAGRLVVAGAGGIAIMLGLDTFVVGAIFVAFGTTTPELAITVISKLRGQEEVGFNTILGSIVINGLFIIGIASVISPISFKWREVSLALLFGTATIAMTLTGRSGYIPRWRGVLLLAMYVAYAVTTLRS